MPSRLSLSLVASVAALMSSCGPRPQTDIVVSSSSENRQPWFAKQTGLDQCQINVRWEGEPPKDILALLLSREAQLSGGGLDIVGIDPISRDLFLIVPDKGNGDCSSALVEELLSNVGNIIRAEISPAMGLLVQNIGTLLANSPDESYCDAVFQTSEDVDALKVKLHRAMTMQLSGLIGYEIDGSNVRVGTMRNCELPDTERGERLRSLIEGVP